MIHNHSRKPVPQAEVAALDRLYDMVRDAEEGYYGRDPAIKWLSDLDIVFFMDV